MKSTSLVSSLILSASTLLLPHAALAQNAPGVGGINQGVRNVKPELNTKTIAALRTIHTQSQTLATFATQAATKADEEGFLAAASLLRAVARVQTTHSSMFEAQLKAVGSTIDPAAAKTTIEVKSTKENLLKVVELALASKDKNLISARDDANSEGNRDAVRVIRWAREGQIEVSRACKDVADLLDRTRSAKKDYFVSKTCGYMVDKLDFANCPVCNAKRDDFVKVN